MQKEILQILSKDFLHNINMLYFIEQYSISLSKTSGDSILLKGKSDREWIMLSSKDEKELLHLLNEVPEKNKCFAFLENWMVPFVARNKKVKWKLSTNQYYLPDNIILPSKKHITKSLCMGDAKFIVEHSDYGEYLSVKYVAERIKRGPSSGIYIDNKLVAWIHTHDDLAIGSLHVLPEYRKKGYGESLLIDMITKIRAIQKVPFGYIEPQNKKSINLITKLGFKKDKTVVWLELE